MWGSVSLFLNIYMSKNLGSPSIDITEILFESDIKYHNPSPIICVYMAQYKTVLKLPAFYNSLMTGQQKYLNFVFTP